MREGDIYHWQWADEGRDADRGPYRSYHCKSQMAVFDGKHLIDTFWGSGPTDGSYLNPGHVTITLLGNKNDMTVLTDRPEFYRLEDMVNMKHSNNSDAPIYLKSGAVRDAEAMRCLLREKQRAARYEIESATRDLERLALADRDIENGSIDNLYF